MHRTKRKNRNIHKSIIGDFNILHSVSKTKMNKDIEDFNNTDNEFYLINIHGMLHTTIE